MTPEQITSEAGRQSTLPLRDGHPTRELIRNADGATVSDLLCRGIVTIQSHGVTVRDSVMDYRDGKMPWDVFVIAGDNAIIEHCTVYGATDFSPAGRVVQYAGAPNKAVFRRNHLVGINSDAIKGACGPNAVVEENWFDGLWHYPSEAVHWDSTSAYATGDIVIANGSAMQRAGGVAQEEGVFLCVSDVPPGHTRPSQSEAWNQLGGLQHSDLVQSVNEHDFTFRNNLTDLHGPGGLNRVAIIAKGADVPVGSQTYTGNIMRDMGGSKPITCFDIDLPYKGQGPVIIDGNTLIYTQWPLHPRRSLPGNILWGTNYTPDGDVIPMPHGAVPLNAGGQPTPPPEVEAPDDRDNQIALLKADLVLAQGERDKANSAMEDARAAWEALAMALK